jgi:hypothetical protein
LEDETMRNAALVLGIIGGIWAMLVGFFVYGYVEFVDWFGEVPDLARQVEDPALFRTVAILSPLLAIAGGGDGAGTGVVGRYPYAGRGGWHLPCLWLWRVHHVPDRVLRPCRCSGAGSRKTRRREGAFLGVSARAVFCDRKKLSRTLVDGNNLDVMQS